MAVGNHQDFEFAGGPYDGEFLSVSDPGDGYPDILVVDYSREPGAGSRPSPASAWTEHRYERDGEIYRYIGEPLEA